MQLQPTSYEYDFLNKYFTTREFDFINNSNSELKKINELFLKETNKRDKIVELINNLNDYISSTDDSQALAPIPSVLSELQQIFNTLNINISSLQQLGNLSKQISDNIVNMLIDAESHLGSISINNSKIIDLKNMINVFSTMYEEIQSSIYLNDVKLEVFYNKDITKYYMDKFNMNIDDLNQKNTQVVSTTYTEAKSFENFEDNHVLIISEKEKKVFLPYSQKEILLYLEQYPNAYKSANDVIKKEFIVSLDYYMKHPVVARFREAYSLTRDREAKTVIDAFKYGIELMFNYDLNPAIIAACKTQQQLENYLTCKEKNKLEDFTDFKIEFRVSPRV